MALQELACPTCDAMVADGSRFCWRCGATVPASRTGEDDGDTTPAAHIDPLFDRVRQAAAGEYDVAAELGRGGMAAVYLAHDMALDRRVALKVMLPELLLSGPDMRERFKREARTAGALSHPNIIPIYHVKETPDLLYFVMKYVEGRSLDSAIKQLGRLPVRMVQAILTQVGGALAYAHRRGVIHRDIKPANIMIDEDGWAVVTDFGIAKVLQAKGLTLTGMTIGTPYYMSPEQWNPKGELTSASDQYSLGIVAYEMLTGEVPFTGEVLAVMMSHHTLAPEPVRSLRPDCPPELESAVMRMLAKTPAERFDSLDDVVTAAGAVMLAPDDPVRTQMVTLARDAPRPRLSIPTSPAPAGRPARRDTGIGPSRTTRRAPRSRRWILAAGVMALVMAGATLIMRPEFLFPRRAASPTQRSSAPERPEGAPVQAPSTTAITRQDTTPLPVDAAKPATQLPASVQLVGLPSGATVRRDQQIVRGNRLELQPGRQYVLSVTAVGFETWTDTVTASEGERLTRTVTMLPVAIQVPNISLDARSTTDTSQSAQRVIAERPPAAYITLGTIPPSAITINGRAVPSNPVNRYEVPVGVVRLHFQVTESTGIWTVDTVLVVKVGDNNFGRIRLRHP